jgi:hypothetical protein
MKKSQCSPITIQFADCKVTLQAIRSYDNELMRKLLILNSTCKYQYVWRHFKILPNTYFAVDRISLQSTLCLVSVTGTTGYGVLSKEEKEHASVLKSQEPELLAK